MDGVLSQREAWDRVKQAHARYDLMAHHRHLDDPVLTPYREEYIDALAVFLGVLRQGQAEHATER
jgi:hypothetical protein